MVNRFAIPCLLLLAAAAAPVQAATHGEDVAATIAVDATWSGAPTAMDGAHVALPGGVTGLPALTYARLRGYRPLTLDLYLPPEEYKSKGPRPVIVVIHGGGWIYGNPKQTAAFANWPLALAALAHEGYVVAAVSYRFGSEAPFPAALQDVKSAVRWLRANASTYAIDKTRFMTWGDSAGGQLSALMATSCGVAALEPQTGDGFGADTAPPSTESDCVQGAVAWYGAYDFTRHIGGPLPLERHPYFGCNGVPCTEDRLRFASPVTYVDPGDPPMLLLHGSADQSAPPAQSEHFLEVLKANHVSARLEFIPGVGHGWIGPTPEATRTASRRAFAASLDFTNATIGDPKR